MNNQTLIATCKSCNHVFRRRFTGQKFCDKCFREAGTQPNQGTPGGDGEN